MILACWAVCVWVVEPYLWRSLPLASPLNSPASSSLPSTATTPAQKATGRENLALALALLTLAGLGLGLLALAWPETSILRGPGGALSEKDVPMMRGLVGFLFVFFALPGLVFGLVSGSFDSAQAVMRTLRDALRPLLGFVVFAFFCSQFLFVCLKYLHPPGPGRGLVFARSGFASSSPTPPAPAWGRLAR